MEDKKSTVMVCGAIGSNDHFAPDSIAERFWELDADRSQVEVKYE